MTILVGMTTELGVAGSPIKHSLSPVIHRAAYSHLGVDFSYQSYEISQGELRKLLDESTLAGVSVTMPLKYEAFELSNSADNNSKLTGVVNTLVRQEKDWVGHNTDVTGFEKCFNQISGADSITILGSGATARSASLAVSRVFPDAKVLVLGRNKDSVDEVVTLLKDFGMNASAARISHGFVVDADLVVSTVPGAAFGELWESVSLDAESKTGTLFDVAYDPWPSIASRSWGPKCISGLELLIWQAIEQVKIFAESNGHLVSVADEDLYGIMRDGIQEQSELK